jgi:hypothetical protein
MIGDLARSDTVQIYTTNVLMAVMIVPKIFK